MGPLGWQETIFIFILALLIFGPRKLPELGKTVAKAMAEFRRASTELKSTWNKEMAAIERESESIKAEARKITDEVKTSYSDAVNTGTSEYGYDGYEYEYDDSYYSGSESSKPADSTAEESSTVGASAVQGAESTESDIPESLGADSVPPAEEPESAAVAAGSGEDQDQMPPGAVGASTKGSETA